MFWIPFYNQNADGLSVIIRDYSTYSQDAAQTRLFFGKEGWHHWCFQIRTTLITVLSIHQTRSYHYVGVAGIILWRFRIRKGAIYLGRTGWYTFLSIPFHECVLYYTPSETLVFGNSVAKKTYWGSDDGRQQPIFGGYLTSDIAYQVISTG